MCACVSVCVCACVYQCSVWVPVTTEACRGTVRPLWTGIDCVSSLPLQEGSKIILRLASEQPDFEFETDWNDKTQVSVTALCVGMLSPHGLGCSYL